MFQYISKYTVYRRNEKEKHIYLQFHNSKLVNFIIQKISRNFFNFNNNSIIVYNRKNEKQRIKKKNNFMKMLKPLESTHL